MDRVQVTRLLLVATILYVIGFYFAGSAIKPGYSQWSNFISEYNATGTPWAGTLTYAGFAATAVLSSLFLIAAAPLTAVSGLSRFGFSLLWCIPASYLLSVAFPCDAGCPVEGSISQVLHNAFGILVYLGMGLGVALVSLAPGFSSFKWRRFFLLFTGIAFPVVFFAMVQPDLAPWRGMLQRSLDVALAASLIMVAWTLMGRGERTRQDVA